MLMGTRERKGVASIHKVCYKKDPLGKASQSRNQLCEACLLPTQNTVRCLPAGMPEGH